MRCPASPERRSVLKEVLRWAAALSGVTLIHPLLRFSGYTIKAKPRYVKIAAPLPRSRVHAERDFFLFAGQDRHTAWANH